MRNVQERVWMTVAKRAYQTEALYVNGACMTIEGNEISAFGMQASGIF